MVRRAGAPASRGGAAAASNRHPDSIVRTADRSGAQPSHAAQFAVVPDTSDGLARAFEYEPEHLPEPDVYQPAASESPPVTAPVLVPAPRHHPRRRRSDVAGPRLSRAIDEQATAAANGLLRLDPILVALADSERHFRILIEQAADGIQVVDANGRITLANSRSCEMLGYSAEEIVGLDLLDTYVPEEREVGRARLQQPPGTSMRFERRLLRRDGTIIPVEISLAWLPNGERQAIMRDIAARQAAEEAHLREEKRLRALVRLSEVEMESLSALLDATLEEVVALSDSAFGYIYYYDEPTEEFTHHAFSQAAMTGRETPGQRHATKLAEAGFWAEAVRQRRPIVVNDFSAPSPHKRGHPESHVEMRNFMTVPVFSRARIVAVVGVGNKAADYSATDVSQLSQMMDVVWKIADRQRAEDDLRQLAEGLERRVVERTFAFESANAELEATNSELGAANSELQNLLREQERLQSELAYRAMHDPLTGLANRSMFQERLDQAFRVSERGVAVVWIDLDHFKEVNDIFGHDVGDEMLLAVADRLRETVRETDDIARMGGDEFAVVLPNVIESEAMMVADRVLAVMTDRNSFRLQMGASVGIGWQRSNSGDGTQLIKKADQAMYRAKAAGGGQAIMA